jgi:FkbM family methyltransferase
MLIPFDDVIARVKSYGIKLTGVFHIGAHDCEEKGAYNDNGIDDNNIIWVEGNPDKVAENKAKGIKNIYEALIFNTKKMVDFNITKDTLTPGSSQSSSILPLDMHSQYYPHIKIDEVKHIQTTTIEQFVRDNKILIQNLNFWNLDIQGVELEALEGAGDMILFADVIYVEVNIRSLYKGCALLPQLEHFLDSKGFTRIATEMTQQGWGDAIFIRNTH